MTETRHGTVVRHFGELVERRPFSRFTDVPAEQAANLDWLARAMEWGEVHVDSHAHLALSVPEGTVTRLDPPPPTTHEETP